MFMNNNIIFLSNFLLFVTIYNVLKIDKVVWGDSAYPFCGVNRGRLCLDRTSNTRIHASRSREFVRFKKRFISCIFPALVYCYWCIIAAGGSSKTTTNWVNLQSGPVRRLFQQTLRAVVLQISRLD